MEDDRKMIILKADKQGQRIEHLSSVSYMNCSSKEPNSTDVVLTQNEINTSGVCANGYPHQREEMHHTGGAPSQTTRHPHRAGVLEANPNLIQIQLPVHRTSQTDDTPNLT